MTIGIFTESLGGGPGRRNGIRFLLEWAQRNAGERGGAPSPRGLVCDAHCNSPRKTSQNAAETLQNAAKVGNHAHADRR